MKEYATLELALSKRPDGYAAELRYSQPQSDADVGVVQDGPALIRFDGRRLSQAAVDAAAYGAQLSEMLFDSPALRTAFARVRSSAQALGLPMRLRLFIGPSAPELHRLAWETLRDPDDGSPLATSERVIFSRYLHSPDMRSVRARPSGGLRALLVIASPSDLGAYRPNDQALAPVDVAGELERARAALAGADVDALASGGKATLAAIRQQLGEADRTGRPYDIVYLVAHGALLNNASRIWLEKDDGAAAVTPGADLAQCLNELQSLPRLVLLLSCQSAGTGNAPASSDRGALAALGPLLAEIGVPAVVAMQGNISMATAARFVPAFFEALQQDGYIDRAMAVARGAVRDRADSWVPVLFMRLKTGRIWYVPGFSDEQDFQRWPALISAVQQGHCTPVLGFGVVESLIGPSREIARRWAEAFRFPMAEHEREDLPQVAQFLAVNQAPRFLIDELSAHIRNELIDRYGANISKDLREASLNDLVNAVAREQQASNPLDPARVLAALPFPIYITTNPSGMLEVALETAGKHPHVELCPWNEYIERTSPALDYQPTPDQPLVYHLFGHLADPRTLVLTEDDYFDYLIGVTRNHDLIPAVVRRALADTALLFLGFQIDDWNFRVLFRSLMSQEGRQRRNRYDAHVAAQIDPEEGRFIEPEGARHYLKTYFQEANITIFWGGLSDFFRQFQEQLVQGAKRGAR